MQGAKMPHVTRGNTLRGRAARIKGKSGAKDASANSFSFASHVSYFKTFLYNYVII